MPSLPDDVDVAVVVEFVAGTRVEREPFHQASLPIVGNGPPGTSVIFAGGARVPLPTDQIVVAEEVDGAARVGFGGMRFDGVEEGQLVFRRVRDVWPAEQLSPERGLRMTLELDMVAAVFVYGSREWPITH